MRKHIFILILFLISIKSFSQVVIDDKLNKDSLAKEVDTTSMDTILLDEVVISKVKLDPIAKKEFLLLQNRVYKVYPFARTAADRLLLMNQTMAKLKSNKEKKRYFKIIEDFMENEFKDKLKKLSHKQGQILVKLIHRQTGMSTYDLIKDYKSGWKAFWSNNTAKLFSIDLKAKYLPYDDNEDYLIETILYRAFVNGRLVEQKSPNPVDLDELNEHWEKRALELKNKTE